MSEARELIHGTCVALGPHARADCAGAPAAGKSDLALRFLALPAERRARAASRCRRSGLGRDGKAMEALVASAPATLAGKIEVRGLGIVEVPSSRGSASSSLPSTSFCRRRCRACRPIRWNESRSRGFALPVVKLAPFELSAPLKLKMALLSAVSPIASSTGIGSGLRVIAVATKIAAFNRADQICKGQHDRCRHRYTWQARA